MKSTDVFDALMNALDTPTIKDLVNDLDKLLSGEDYERFMSMEITPNTLPEIIVGATLTLELVHLLPDKILAELTPDLRARILTYLDRCQKMYSAAVFILNDKVKNTVSSPKHLEEMTRDELLAYIKEQLKD